MIFVVIMAAAISTIIAASVDLGRMAVYKQHQLEREAKWQYCVDSAKAHVVGDLFINANYSQSFSKTVNGINLTISSDTDSWTTNGCKMTVSGTLDGKTRSSTVYMGKRATAMPCQFGMFFLSSIVPTGTVDLNGDLYYGGSITGTSIDVDGNVYSSSATAPAFASLTGSFIGRQPVLSIALDDNAYQNAASVTTSGNTTLTNPLNLLSLSQSQLRYHSGNLTIRGTVTGEITIFVKGTVTIKSVSTLTTLISRLVVICDGDIYIDGGTSTVFAICNGTVSSTSSKSARTINGSIAGKNLSDTNDTFDVNFDNYFVSYPAGGYRYRIPGQW